MYRSGVNKQFVWDLVSVGTWRGSQEPTGTMGRCAWPTSPCRSLVRAHEEPCTAAHMHTPHTHTHTAKHPSAGKRKQTEACSHTPTLHTAEDEYVHSGNIPHVPGVWQALLWVFRVSQ